MPNVLELDLPNFWRIILPPHPQEILPSFLVVLNIKGRSFVFLLQSSLKKMKDQEIVATVGSQSDTAETVSKEEDVDVQDRKDESLPVTDSKDQDPASQETEPVKPVIQETATSESEYEPSLEHPMNRSNRTLKQTSKYISTPVASLMPFSSLFSSLSQTLLRNNLQMRTIHLMPMIRHIGPITSAKSGVRVCILSLYAAHTSRYRISLL